MAVLAVELQLDPGALMRSAEEHPQIVAEMCSYMLEKAQEEDTKRQREKLRAELKGQG